MKTIEIAGNRHLRKIVDQAADETVMITSAGRPVAALVSMEGIDAESLSLGTNSKFLRILRKSFKEIDHGRQVSLAEMRKRVGA